MNLSSLRRVVTCVLTASVVLSSASIFAGSVSAQASGDSNASYVQVWMQGLTGRKLVTSKSESSGGGGGTVSAVSEWTYHFCSNGQVTGVYKSIVSGSVAGMSFGDDGAKQEVYPGQWKVVDAGADWVRIELSEEKQGKAVVGFKIVNGALYANNGNRFSVSQSEYCQ